MIGTAAAAAVAAMVALLVFGRGILALWGRQMAARCMKVGAVCEAQQWLSWSARFDPGDGRTDLMRAGCFRQLGQMDRWRECLQSAEQEGVKAAQIQQEALLGRIHSGELPDQAEGRWGALAEAAAPHEVAAAFLHGDLARGNFAEAKRLLDAWAARHPGDAHVAYLWGGYWWWSGDLGRAEAEFKNALARQPRHDLARTALAELLEQRNRLEEALGQYADLAGRFPASETATLGLARLSRKLGHLDEARAAMGSLALQPRPPSRAAVEAGQIELESGNYQQAQRWFGYADLGRTEDSNVLSAAATALALAGKINPAERLFDRLDAANGRAARIYDLQVRLAVDPGDEAAAAELQRLSLRSTAAPGETGVPGPEKHRNRRPTSPPSAAELYARHCSACHGAGGDGNGRAARHLFPRPRDLRTGKFRLVSTLNGVATLEDIEAVIKRGMPGTSMPAFEKLTDRQRALLAGEVLRLNREGIRDQFVGILKREGEEVDQREVREVVALCTTPGEVVRVPQITPGDSQAIARGKEAYFALGCEHCHGNDGRGAWDASVFDEQGRPDRPRDLVREPLKGGEEPESMYLRIFVGMPGTPHPACYNVPEKQLIDLVRYCGSLSREPKRMLTNHQRLVQATSRAYLAALGGAAAR